MEPVVVGLAVAAVVIVPVPEAVPERVRPTAILAAGSFGCLGGVWIAWEHSTWPPLMLAIALPVAAVLAYKHQWGPGTRRDQGEAIASLLEPGGTPIRGEARLLTEWTGFGSRRGWLDLNGPCLRFTLEDGEVVFDVDVRDEPNLSLGLWRRGQLRLKRQRITHKLVFGHSTSMDLDGQRQAVEFWKIAIGERVTGE